MHLLGRPWCPSAWEETWEAGLGGWAFGVLGFKVWGLGFRVWGLGFRVWGLGFRVWGLGFGRLSGFRVSASGVRGMWGCSSGLFRMQEKLCVQLPKAYRRA